LRHQPLLKNRTAGGQPSGRRERPTSKKGLFLGRFGEGKMAIPRQSASSEGELIIGRKVDKSRPIGKKNSSLKNPPYLKRFHTVSGARLPKGSIVTDVPGRQARENWARGGGELTGKKISFFGSTFP